MSKIDVGVGDEFPLDETRPEEGRHTWREERRGRHRHHHRGHHGHHHHHHGHHHRHHGFSRLAFLLVIAGTGALLVEHQLTREIALGMIGAGIGLMAVMFMVHALWHRRHAGQAS